MKKVLLFLMLLSATSVFAQDVIVKKDGSTILSKVVEIGSAEVKYKKFSNQNGPTYTIPKSEIQAINYENGEKENFTDAVVTQPQQTVIVNNYDDILSSQKNYQKEKLLLSAKHWRNAALACGYIGVIAGVGSALLLYKDKTACTIVACSCIGGGLLLDAIFAQVANNKEEHAYAITSSTLIKQDFNLGNSRLSAGVNLMNDKHHKDYALGLGLSLNF